MRPAYPHEKRFQRYAYATLAALALLTAFLALSGEASVLGVEVGGFARLLALLGGLVVGILAVHRRSGGLALASAALFVAGVAPVAQPDPGLAGYALGLLFGVLLLAYGELVHLTTRYDRAHAAVEKENVPESHLDRVSDEAVKTLGARALLALGLAAAGVLLAFLLARWGPLRQREALETTAPLGVALSSLALMAGLALFILSRGERREEPPPKELPADEPAP